MSLLRLPSPRERRHPRSDAMLALLRREGRYVRVPLPVLQGLTRDSQSRIYTGRDRVRRCYRPVSLASAACLRCSRNCRMKMSSVTHRQLSPSEPTSGPWGASRLGIDVAAEVHRHERRTYSVVWTCMRCYCNVDVGSSPSARFT